MNNEEKPLNQRIKQQPENRSFFADGIISYSRLFLILFFFVVSQIQLLSFKVDQIQLDVFNNTEKVVKQQYKSTLMFVHIPKTAGSTIEAIGASQKGDAKQKWGYNEFCDGINHGECIKKTTCGIKYNNTTTSSGSPCYKGCSSWHDPKLLSFRANSSVTMKTTFCIIRNPRDRLLSSFKYNRGKGRQKNGCSAKFLNMWTKYILKRHLKRNQAYSGCHFLRQTDFPCEKKLLFDHLEEQFDALMRENNLNITFRVGKKRKKKVLSVRKSTNCPDLSTKDFNDDNQKLIKKYYAKDMALYYELLRPYII